MLPSSVAFLLKWWFYKKRRLNKSVYYYYYYYTNERFFLLFNLLCSCNSNRTSLLQRNTCTSLKSCIFVLTLSLQQQNYECWKMDKLLCVWTDPQKDTAEFKRLEKATKYQKLKITKLNETSNICIYFSCSV